LTTAHKKLALRLARFGFAVSGASLAALLAEHAAPANVPTSLLTSTAKVALLLTTGQVTAVSATVITLTEGVLRTMFIAKIKNAAIVLLAVAILGSGAGFFTHASRADRAVAAGGKVVQPTTDLGPHGTIALIRDLDGNVVGIHTAKA